MNNPFDPGYYYAEELKEMGFKSIGDNVSVAKNCTFINLHNISIASHVRIDGGTTIVAGNTGVEVGNYIHIGGGAFLLGTYGISLADFANLSQGVRIYTGNDDYTGGSFTNPMVPSDYTNITTGPVRLDKHVIIGSGSVILPNIQLHEGTSIGALSLVRKSTKAWTVYSGNPAKELMTRKVIDPDGSIEEKLLKNITT